MGTVGAESPGLGKCGAKVRRSCAAEFAAAPVTPVTDRGARRPGHASRACYGSLGQCPVSWGARDFNVQRDSDASRALHTHYICITMIHTLLQLQAHPVLKNITFDGITTFTRLASRLKREIIQPQPLAESDPTVPPLVLPQSISASLAACLNIPLECMQNLWLILREHAWDQGSAALLCPNDYLLFKQHGWAHGLS